MNAAVATGQHYDVIIAGGGMVGASLALSLSQHALNILLVERAPLRPEAGPATYHPSFDARSTALSYGSGRIFQSLGLWDTLQAHAATIETIHVSQRGQFGATHMHRDDVGWPALGYVVENPWLGNCLLAAVAARPAITVAAPAMVTQVTPGADCAAVALSGDTTDCDITASLVVVADGADSPLRRQLGIGVRRHDYHQQALIANVSFGRPHAGRAFERFTDEGPLALLPLPDSDTGEPRAALVWTLDPERALDVSAMNDAGLLAAVQERFGHRLGAFHRIGERSLYPLQRVETEESLRHRIVLVGNAAHALHPVAGQGFNLALRDCRALTDVVSRARQRDEDIGALPVLQRYIDGQDRDQRRVVQFSDKLPQLFAGSCPAWSLARGLGLAGLDLIPPLKRGFIHHTAGMFDGAAGGHLS